MTNSKLLLELSGLFRDYELESSSVLITASLQFVSRVDPGCGDEPIMSEIYCWGGGEQGMVVLPEEIREKMR